MERCGHMYCLKCGREIEDQQVYCSGCLEIMERYPIKPGTPVQLPKKNPIPAQKKQNRRGTPSLEDQLRHQRRIIKVLISMLLVVSLAASFFAFQYFQPEATEDEPSPGQSWSVASEET